MTFFVKQNDTSPTLDATLKDADDAAVDLTGASVRFHMRKVGKGTAVVDGAATITGALTGQVRYAWSGSDTASIGTYNGEFEVTYSDGTIETFPNNGFISIEITDDLA